MIIRPAEKSDIPKIFEINSLEVPKVNFIDEKEIEWYLRNADYFWVAEIDNVIAGLLVVLKKGHEYDSENYQWFLKNYDNFLYVDRIIVSRNHRDKGVGKALYQILYDVDDTAPVITCEVNLNPPNEGSVHFHQKMGFEEVAQQWTVNRTKLVSLMVQHRNK